MDRNDKTAWLGVGILLFFCLLSGMAGYSHGINTVRLEAIDRNKAEFNTKTGEWQWKD
jgi:hypothetical protein